MAISSTYIYWRGGKFNRTSIASLLRAEKLSKVSFRVMQGGYNRGGVAASAGTHDGGGVVDLSVSGWSAATRSRVCAWLRRCGWAAWVRTPAQGFAWHIHAVRVGDATASAGARAQVVAYRYGRNGLAGNGYDTQTRQTYVSWENSRYNPANAVQKASRPASMTIEGKAYPGLSSVSVYWINNARKSNGFSRHIYCMEQWLSTLGYNKGGTNDGWWGPGIQADLDKFRWDHRKALGITNRAGAQGSVGLASLTLINHLAKSKRSVRKGK